MPGLKDYAEKQAEGVPLRLEDVEGVPVNVTGVAFNYGQFGVYAIMQAERGDGEAFELMSGAKLVVDALEHATKADAFPLMARFVRRGRTWIVEDA